MKNILYLIFCYPLISFWKWIQFLFFPKKFVKEAEDNTWVFNPVLQLPQNLQCLCLSGKKVKHCCGRYREIPRQTAIEVEKKLKKFAADRNIKLKKLTNKELGIGK